MLASDREYTTRDSRQRYVLISDQSPTDFWLDTYPITKVFDTPELISSLASYSEQLQDPKAANNANQLKTTGGAQSVLFLRIQAAASYYSTNRTLMDYPPPVDVDISKSQACCIASND